MKRVFVAVALFAAVNIVAETSLRTKLGENTPLEHTKSEIRFGYIYQDNRDKYDTKALGFGGHLHIYTKEFYGFSAVSSFYAVGDFGLNPSLDETNENLLGSKKRGAAFVSEAYVKYHFGKSVLKAGRMMVDTPHADSDDIMMIPNFFQGVCFKSYFYKDIEITFAKLDKMAGWENGIDASKFVNISEVIGVEKRTDGMALASIEYEKGYKNISIWFYKIYDIADDYFITAGNSFLYKDLEFYLAFQLDRAINSGDSLLGKIDTKTFGVLTELFVKDVKIQWAYNEELGSTKSFFSLGGGPFFTSLEEQTIDSIQAKNAKSYTLGVEYYFNEDITIGVARGVFKAGNEEEFYTIENDIYVEATLKDDINLQFVCAFIDDQIDSRNDHNIFRVVLKKSFRR
ncbi:OprD family outer membrane porin [Nitrosophilus labii]|uniref:OprD family outer membrane porin n=1 Tax=Nitrosophilus labii TaxID=2706014 RepID=UPI0016574691|nr:OprD family outer membrane porin [Nitrosophilus labii]